jgi:acyl-CoA reductase-like NAD-dependent aldehyde dehydrogenase
MSELEVVTPVDGSVYARRKLSPWSEVDRALERADRAAREWRTVPLAERMALCRRFADRLAERAPALGEELAWQMGRPVRFAPREVTTAADRARRMVALAPEALADAPVDAPSDDLQLFIRREPLGVVLVIPAWNYPYLIAVNSVVPALLAGNAVVLKHSSQTPLVAERFGEALAAAGLPEGVFQWLHAGHGETERAVADPRVGFVAFTGSVRGGHEMVAAAKDRFIALGLELGGKDPAYVRADADVGHAVENLVDGSFFNSGQSCCGIERIYVHRDAYDSFVAGFVELTRRYRLGSPLDPEVDLGPVARAPHAAFVRGEVAAAVARGARSLVPESEFPAARAGGPYVGPQVLVEVDHGMSVMREETFGPVVGIMAVSGDDEAVELMNDSPYGLTASVWTRDRDAALEIGSRVETGTWFMNRCDWLDPGLAWVGVKDSGRGCTLSKLGYEQLTRPKSYHLRRVG